MINGILIVFIVFMIYMMIRNRRVCCLRKRANRDIYESNVSHKKRVEMWDRYDTVSYNSMLWRVFTSTKKIEKEFREITPSQSKSA